VGSDRARISFDPTRDYRSVVAQQGRVTLEADINEQAMIASEALRLETIDFIGPAGTPDNGYQVSVDGSGNVSVGPGTMYVGGWRMELAGSVNLASQPEWLDMPAPSQTAQSGNDLVALLVTEQSISATEDQALQEVALGGPDTAARTRLMQHFVEIPTSESQCGAAEKDLNETLEKMGLILNSKTLELDFIATLEVGFFPPTQPADPCCPPAQGGYLGADNQLVQVTVSSFTSPSGNLLWGWNNASFLYRATVVGPQVLQLSQAPVDAAHTPQPGQVIEVLRTTTVLGDSADDNYVAAPQGLIVTLGTGTVYDPTTQQLTVPPGTTLPTDPNTLFVRLWQAQVPFTSGQQVQLDNVSGLAVTVKIKALPTGSLLARPFWCFAVRPNTPQQVYPQRYLEGPQPADGPRQWLCALAVLTPGAAAGPVTPDCRLTFLPLTKLDACTCCNLVLDVSEDWLGTLNTALASDAIALSICFQPGEFQVTGKIAISKKIVKITGAGAGTAIIGKSLEAVLEFDNCPSVSLSDICVEAGTAGYSAANATKNLQGAVTFRNCAYVDIERVWLACADADLRSASCLYVYNTRPTADAAQQPFNVRVLNSEFKVGSCQAGILLVNADRAQVEGNLVVTPMQSRNINPTNLSSHPEVEFRLEKQLVHELTLVDTAPPTTKKAKERLRKKQAAGKATPAEATHAPGADATAPAKNADPSPAGAAAPSPVNTVSKTLPHINLGAVGRAHVTATFGTVKLQFVSSEKLTNAWTDALSKAGLSATSGMGAVHLAVKNIAAAVVKNSQSVAPAFRNYLATLLPQLYSTSSQGIVVAGDVASDIRILNNTIEGTAQGIHVGLSDMKATPLVSHLQADQVQVCGNTVAIRMTPETTGDRHGIFLGGVTSAIVNDNNLELTRTEDAGQDIYAIKVTGALGPRVLVERNYMKGFSLGIFAQPSSASTSQGALWKAADNWSNASNSIPGFISTDNVS
jgi:hypothetical protein